MKNIIFKTNIESADWISTDNCWNLVTSGGKKFSCNVLFGCTGYFSYENPNEPTFPGTLKEFQSLQKLGVHFQLLIPQRNLSKAIFLEYKNLCSFARFFKNFFILCNMVFFP